MRRNNKTRHILQPFNDADLSALLRGSTRRKCPFPETFTMPFSVSRGNTNNADRFTADISITQSACGSHFFPHLPGIKILKALGKFSQFNRLQMPHGGGHNSRYSLRYSGNWKGDNN